MERQHRIERAICAANLIFWMKVAEHFPEAIGGDLPPDLSIEFAECQRRSVEAWVKLNVPPDAPSPPANWIPEY